jgi:hypothetical protein
MRRRQAPRWPIDPKNVEYGSVVLGDGQGVRVRYVGESGSHCAPIPVFIRETTLKLRKGNPLGVTYLRISPRTKRRYGGFFDGLTDWTQVARTTIDRIRQHHSVLTVDDRNS